MSKNYLCILWDCVFLFIYFFLLLIFSAYLYFFFIFNVYSWPFNTQFTKSYLNPTNNIYFLNHTHNFAHTKNKFYIIYVVVVTLSFFYFFFAYVFFWKLIYANIKTIKKNLSRVVFTLLACKTNNKMYKLLKCPANK